MIFYTRKLGLSLETRKSPLSLMMNVTDLTICSRSRHENSTLDEHADFETNLAKITLPDGEVSGAYPRTLKELFSYDGQPMHLSSFGTVLTIHQNGSFFNCSMNMACEGSIPIWRTSTDSSPLSVS